MRAAQLIVAVVAVAVYADSLANGFAYDDVPIIESNRAIQSWETLPDALRTPYWPRSSGRENGLWRPVATAAYGVEYIAGGGTPMIFHGVNVLMHAVASVLTVTFLAMILSLPAAFLGGLVFAIHPVHVEAVANVVGFAEITSTVAILLACMAHLRSGARSGWRDAAVVGMLYAIGFGTKEGAVTLPGLIFLIDAARGRIGLGDVADYLRDRWRTYVVLVLVATGMMLVRHRILGSFASASPPLGAEILAEIPRIWTLGEIWLHYARLWVFPLDLASDYSPDLVHIRTGWTLENSLGVFLALSVLALSLCAWRRPPMRRGADTGRAAAFGLVWFVMTMSPVSNTVFLSGTLLAERTFYLPSIGLAAATGWLAVRAHRARPRVTVSVVLLLLSLGAARTWLRNPTWKDNPTVFTTLMGDYPQSGRTQWYLGDLALRNGQVESALRSYRLAIGLLGADYELLVRIGRTLATAGEFQAAERLLRRAAADRPLQADAYVSLASVLAEQGDVRGTEQAAWAALATREDAVCLHLLAWALAAQGRMAEAASTEDAAKAAGPTSSWQRHVYDAYALRDVGDGPAIEVALDSAWAEVHSERGLATLDSVIVSEFGLPSRMRTPAKPRSGTTH